MNSKFRSKVVRVVSELVYRYFIKTRVYEPKGIRILCYHEVTENRAPHDIYTLSLQEFEKQIALIREEGYNVISLKDLLYLMHGSGKTSSRLILLTFDDGFKGFYSLAYPVLKRYGYPAVLFITTGYINRDRRFMTWDDIYELKEEGLVDFGAHGVLHISLIKATHATAVNELRKSKEEIEAKLSVVVEAFSYPYGTYNEFVKSLTKDAGFKLGFTARFGINTSSTDLFELRRITIFSSDSLSDFRKKLLGAYDWRGLF